MHPPPLLREPPFVHPAALDSLRRALEGPEAVTLLCGPPGTGKRRLVQEFLAARDPATLPCDRPSVLWLTIAADQLHADEIARRIDCAFWDWDLSGSDEVRTGATILHLKASRGPLSLRSRPRPRSPRAVGSEGWRIHSAGPSPASPARRICPSR